MALLKEDGSLDVDWIRNLPFEEHVKVIGRLNPKQVEEYCSKSTINETYTSIHAVKIDKPIEELGLDAMEFINKMREKYENI